MTEYVGAPFLRKEEIGLLRGEVHFVADIYRPGELHVAFVRSQHGHARLRGIDASAARDLPGIVGVFTAADFDRRLGPIPVRVHPNPSLKPYLQDGLASHKVRYVGDPIAAVVAVSRAVAEDGAALVDVDYEVLPSVVNGYASIEDGAPILFEQAGSNLASSFSESYGDIDEAFERAALVVSGTFTTNRHTGSPMETRGLVADYDEATDRMTVWGPTKVVHANRQVVAELLDIPATKIRFIAPAVGGGFGIRGEIYPEDLVIPYLCWVLKRPVKWIEDRREHLIAANHSREQLHETAMAFDAEGRILGMKSAFVNDMGGYLRTHGVRVPEISAATQPGAYRMPAYRCDVRCVLTNKTPSGTYRSPGRFEINFVRESLLDRAARKLGIDAIEIRRRNLLTDADMPYQPGTLDFGQPIIFDSGDPLAVMEQALTAARYHTFRQRQRDARAQGRRIGIGVVPFMEDGGLGGLGGTPGEYAQVVLGADGKLTIFSGVCDLGQGFRTTLAQVCADEFRIDPDQIEVVFGDTDRVAKGGGTWASRGAILAGNSCMLASRQLRDRIHAAAAEHFGCDLDGVTISDGAANSNGVVVTFAELASRMAPNGELIEANLTFTTPHMSYAPGAQIAVVEVDDETGVVTLIDHVIAYDVGRALNPLFLEGQMNGGAAQGIGGAMLEEFAYDDNGQPLVTTFADYLLPSVCEIPPAQQSLVLQNARSPTNPLGTKGGGEVGPAAAGAAIANAVADALSDLAIEVDRLPLSPDRVLGLITRARAGTASSAAGARQ